MRVAMNNDLSYDLAFEFTEICMEEVFLFDASGRILDANQRARESTGYLDSIEEHNISEIFRVELKVEDGKIRFEDGKTYVTVEYRENNTCFPCHMKAIRSAKDSNMGICLSIDDSERNGALKNYKMALDRMNAVTKMKDQFTANITHELRTPINGISGLVKSLLDTELDSTQEDTLNLILRCCSNMTKIINDILDFAKIEAGKLTIENREFNLKKLLDEIMALNASVMNEKGLKFMIDIGHNIPTMVIGDDLRLGQVLNNLFSNAIKFTEQGSIGFEVSVIDRKDDTVELIFVIIDSGIGIGEDEKDKLFTSFSQVDGSITRRFGGTGLGLAICKQLVEQMGGRIGVQSEKGKGSTFSFTIKVGVSGNDTIGETGGMHTYKTSFVKVDKKSSLSKVEEEIRGYNDIDEIFKNEGDEKDDERVQLEGELEKLVICIELGTWDKAEMIATNMKTSPIIAADGYGRKVFALLLAIRKEDHDRSIELAEELCSLENVLWD